jgi:ParB family chromosome partitioning protein
VWCEEVDGLDELAAKLKAERDENTCRMPFTPSEAVAIGKAIEAAEKPKAAARKSPGVNQHTKAEVSGNLPETSTGQARDIAAAAAGMSGTTYEHAKKVVDAAAAPDAKPEVIEAARKMDETGKVDPAYQVARVARVDSGPGAISTGND